ncbi:hypothetical protein KDL44_06480 [bacterium]|nr:hypothetical protein [bacterium]
MTRTKLDTAIVRCVEKLQSESGLSLAQIAEMVGMNYEPMRNLVRGNVKRPYFDVILKLHELAGFSMDEQFGLQTREDREWQDVQKSFHQLKSHVEELELEKRLLLDWIRKYAMESGDTVESTVIKFINQGRTTQSDRDDQQTKPE